MELRQFWFGLDTDKREALALDVGSTTGHLNNVAYGYRPCAPALCVQIERAANGSVMRWDLRPDDWHLIWPELLQRPDAPKPQEVA